jgi:uncharacterized protein (TIGR03089 family)
VAEPRRFDELVLARARRDGDRPYVTFYDDARGERVELSARTFENWTAKTANLLAEELGVEPGDRVASALGGHWQALVVAFACWRLGACLAPVPPQAPPERRRALLAAAAPAAVLAREELLGDARDAAPGAQLVAVPQEALGGARRDFGAVANFARLVPAMGDLFEPPPGDLTGEALAAGAPDTGAPLRLDGLLQRARAAAGRLGLDGGDRVAVLEPLETLPGLVDGALAAWWAGAGVLLVQQAGAARLWGLLAQERASALLAPAGSLEELLAAARGGPGEGPRLRVVACGSGELPAAAAGAWAARFGTAPLPAAPGR